MIHITQSALEQIIQMFNNRKSAVGLSEYSVGELLDHGGMSNIYRIIDGSGNTDYVLRISEEHKSSYSNDIFNVREMEILRELKRNRQPHVVQYIDAFVADIPGLPRYYCSVMKFLSTLKHYRVQDDGEEIVVRLGCDLLPLLQSFSDKHILHRDIKPENIFYDKDFRNKSGFMLGDFGIAKHDSESSVTPTGSESTMAPETRGLDRSLLGEKFRSDMYSLGMVMYLYLNEGIYPSNHERIDKIPPDTHPFPEPRYGSKRLKALVLRATSYHPGDRFDSPQAMLRELQKCDEYRKYILHESQSINATIDASKFIEEENERLRNRILQQQNSFSEKYSHAVYGTAKNSALTSSAQSTRLNPAPFLIGGLAGLIILVCILTVVVISSSVNKGGLSESSTHTDNIQNTEEQSTSSRTDSGKNSSHEAGYDQLEVSSEKEPLILYEGDIFTMGRYPQGANGEIMSVKWRVLDIQGKKALLISEDLLDYIPYNDTKSSVTWQKCSLRRWLNSYFINTAFTDDEQKLIVSVNISNPDNDEYGVNGGNDTKDRIFVLSIDEALSYFSSDGDRIAYSTKYTHSKGKDSNQRSDWWILRSPGSKSSRAASITDKGKLDADGNEVNHAGIAVRPALWLNMG